MNISCVRWPFETLHLHVRHLADACPKHLTVSTFVTKEKPQHRGQQSKKKSSLTHFIRLQLHLHSYVHFKMCNFCSVYVWRLQQSGVSGFPETETFGSDDKEIQLLSECYRNSFLHLNKQSLGSECYNTVGTVLPFHFKMCKCKKKKAT